ncbi:outer membrane insertion c-terminal signal protein [Tamlana sedimentorum]|uniref:Outer membrane insertion c-terminal signal protein n=1 Tax=Neotamlana sedimentorum TaxID=1435349 RepID=A0A0D7W7S3_9FLAO|nr:porin family protein [Tamlana sedimentorum]KJD35171.1 outer membrane insertion c-terminal signal protein [Tamlana sedimentorum]
MKHFLIFLLGFNFCVGFSQEQNTAKVVSSRYKEDQFYAAITYNVLHQVPDKLSQTGFSLGFHLGHIKDIPLNIRRNFAIGIGLGYSTNSFNQNLLINKEVDNSFNYAIVDEDDFSKNKFSNHFVELPVEFRWRTSTATDYNFWRIYAGLKLRYMFLNNTKYKGDLGSIKFSNISEFNKFQYGLTLSAGYNTWNFYTYYGLNPILKNAALSDGTAVNMTDIKLGLIFYIL